jgi:hypothetical protein
MESLAFGRFDRLIEFVRSNLTVQGRAGGNFGKESGADRVRSPRSIERPSRFFCPVPHGGMCQNKPA